MGFDTTIFQWLNSFAGVSWLCDQSIVFLASHLWYLMAIAVVLLSCAPCVKRFKKFCCDRRTSGKFLLFVFSAALIARFIVTEFIRLLYDRLRPFEVLDEVRQLVAHAGSASFPSGHAAFSFALAAAVSYYYPKTSILFFAGAIAVGLGRVAAGIHWPSDILGGALVGIGTAWLLRKFFKK